MIYEGGFWYFMHSKLMNCMCICSLEVLSHCHGVYTFLLFRYGVYPCLFLSFIELNDSDYGIYRVLQIHNKKPAYVLNCGYCKGVQVHSVIFWSLTCR